MDATFGTVLHSEQLTPRMVRVVLGGEGLASFTPAPATDQYVNALFVPEGAPYSAPFEVDEARRRDDGFAPRGRRETVRRWDADAGELTLDIVTHGDEGYAGRWANHAQPGDRLQLLGPNGSYSPRADADWHLFVGDESALPAIGASLEAMSEGATAVVVVAVDGPEHELALTSSAEVELRWVHRCDAVDDPDALLRAVEALTFPVGQPQVFVHGEAGEVRAVRKHLLGERGVSEEGQSISPYWRRKHTDEQWRAIKKQWLAESATDV